MKIRLKWRFVFLIKMILKLNAMNLYILKNSDKLDFLIPCTLVAKIKMTRIFHNTGMGTDFEKKTATCAVTRWISLHPHPT